MIRFPQQQGSRVTGQPILPAPYLHRPIERRLKQRTLAFTHEIPPFDLPQNLENPVSVGFYADNSAEFASLGE